MATSRIFCEESLWSLDHLRGCALVWLDLGSAGEVLWAGHVRGMHKNSLQVELGMPAWWRKIIPSKNDREIRRYKGRVEQINALEASMKALPDEALPGKD